MTTVGPRQNTLHVPSCDVAVSITDGQRVSKQHSVSPESAGRARDAFLIASNEGSLILISADSSLACLDIDIIFSHSYQPHNSSEAVPWVLFSWPAVKVAPPVAARSPLKAQANHPGADTIALRPLRVFPVLRKHRLPQHVHGPRSRLGPGRTRGTLGSSHPRTNHPLQNGPFNEPAAPTEMDAMKHPILREN